MREGNDTHGTHGLRIGEGTKKPLALMKAACRGLISMIPIHGKQQVDLVDDIDQSTDQSTVVEIVERSASKREEGKPVACTRNMSSFNTDANQYDQVLRMLETTRRQKQKISSSPRLSRRTGTGGSNWTTARQESDENSTFDSRNETATLDTILSEADTHTRQSLVDRSPQDGRSNSIDSFIARSTSSVIPHAQSSASAGEEFVEGTVDSTGLASGPSPFLQEPLPKAILKLDRCAEGVFSILAKTLSHVISSSHSSLGGFQDQGTRTTSSSRSRLPQSIAVIVCTATA